MTQPPNGRPRPSIDAIAITGPCSKRWDELGGQGASRFCDSCALHVHDLSSRTRRQAQRVVEQSKGRLCVTYLADAEGKPVFRAGAFSRLRQRAARLLHWSGWIGLGGMLFSACGSGEEPVSEPAPESEDAQETQLLGRVAPGSRAEDSEVLQLLGYVD